MRELKYADEIMNKALNLATTNLLSIPIQGKLKVEFPQLSTCELNEINDLCQDIRNEGYDFIYNKLSESPMSQSELKILFEDHFKSNYPWISDDTLSKIYSQGGYMAWKDGLI